MSFNERNPLQLPKPPTSEYPPANDCLSDDDGPRKRNSNPRLEPHNHPVSTKPGQLHTRDFDHPQAGHNGALLLEA